MNKQFEMFRLEPSCMGDVFSNDMVDKLSTINGSRRKRIKQLKSFIQEYMEHCNDRWLFRRFGKDEIAALCALVNSSTQATYEKRALNYIQRLIVKCSVYSALFNSSKVEMFQRHFKCRIELTK